MDKYYSYDVLLEMLERAQLIFDAEDINRRVLRLLYEIESLPVADVRENVRGEWISEPGIGFLCSKCGLVMGNDWDSVEHVNFCPNCGAQMKGAVHE